MFERFIRRPRRLYMSLLAVVAVSGALIWTVLIPFRSSVPVASEGAAPHSELAGDESRVYLERTDEGRSLMRALEVERFGLRWQESAPFVEAGGGGGYLGMSHDENLNVWFDAAGVTVRPMLSEQERERAWRLGMRLKAYGYGAQLHEARASGSYAAKENRIEYERAASGDDAGGRVVEWYVNKSEGIEQGFTLDAPPARTGAADAGESLRLVVAVSGGLRARASEDGQSVELSRGSEGLLSYSKLTASDAEGRKLAARMETNEAGDEIALLVDDAGARYPVVVDPITATLEKKLDAGSFRQLDARFGFAVSISGDRAVVGAWREDVGASVDAGAAYFFQRSGTSWSLTRRFTRSSASAGDKCGWSVALHGDLGAIGCPGANSGTGTAYVYNVNNDLSLELLTLPGTRSSGAAYGTSIDASFVNTDGNYWVVVGEPLDASLGANNGAALIYRVTLTSSAFAAGYSSRVLGPLNNGECGTSVAIDNATLLVGCPGSLFPGSVIVSEFVSGDWQSTTTLRASDGINGDAFGQSVAVSRNTAVVGAPLDDNQRGTDAGAAYVFVSNAAGQWSEQQKLTAGDGRAGDFFSEHAVAIDYSNIVVGAYSNGEPLSGNADDDRGAAYLFTRSGAVWTQQAKISPSNFSGGEPAAHLGISVDLDFQHVIIGARAASAGDTSSAGAAFVYKLDCLAIDLAPVRGIIAGSPSSASTFNACPGNNVQLILDVERGSPTSYQWRRNGVNIPGANGSTYVINSASASDAGSYDVVVSNACNTQVSTAVTLNVRSFNLNPTAQNFSAAGSNGIVNVTSNGSCGWTAQSNVSWITITSGAAGTGNGTVGFNVAANTGTVQRTGTLTIAGKTFNVTQDGAMTVTPTIQFTQSSYTVSEGAGSINVTVTRAGDTSVAATVEYATTDGTAKDRSDYNTTIGRLRFAAGENSKSLTVLVTDDAYLEGVENFNLTLSNPTGGSALGTPSAATLNINDNDASASTTNPLDTTTFFVRQQYVDFLSREPDAPGLAFWIGGIDSCGANASCREVKRIDTSAAFFLSIEFQETGFLVHRLYRAAFNRLTRYREFIRDTQEIGRGVVVNSPGWEAQLEANKVAFISEFAARADFQSLYNGMSNAQFVDALNANTGGSLSTTERNALVSGLNGGTETRATALRKVAEDADFRARETSPAFVLLQYFGYLRRNPDDPPEPGLNFDGYNFWLSKLNSFGGDYRRAELVKAFLAATEYRQRFGQP